MGPILLPLLLAFLVSCQITSSKRLKPQDLLTPKDIQLIPPAHLNEKAIKTDCDLVVYALRRGYGGRDHLPRGTFDTIIAQLNNIHGSMSPAKLRDKIDEVLLSVPDNHLRARLNWEASIARLKSISRPGVGDNAASEKTKIWEVRLDSLGTKKILYVSILRFSSRRDRIWDSFLPKIKSLINSVNMVVLDFRGNEGGDDSTGRELAKLFYGNDFDHPITRQHVSQTPESLILFANLFRVQQLIKRNRNEDVPQYLEDLYQEWFEKYQSSLRGATPVTVVNEEPRRRLPFNPTKGFGKPIYILMDGRCKSSCESTIDAFESHPNVKKVGSHTLGMIQFGNTGVLVLPNSKVTVEIPLHYNEYFDDRSLEKIGIKPDIQVPQGEDAYLYLKGLLSTQH